MLEMVKVFKEDQRKLREKLGIKTIVVKDESETFEFFKVRNDYEPGFSLYIKPKATEIEEAPF